MTQTLCRLLRLAVSCLCLLSLLACAGAGWLWWRSYNGGHDRVSFIREGERHTLRSLRGRLVLYGPPPGATGANRGGVAPPPLRNRDVRWRAYRVPAGGGPYRYYYRYSYSWADLGPTAGRPRDWLLAFSDGAPPGAEGPLLRALEDPERFVAAHFWLTGSGYGPDDRVLPLPGGERGVGVYNGLQLEVALGPDGPVGVRVNPTQLPAIRDYWHGRLDVPVWSIRYSWLVTAAAFPALFWSGIHLRRNWVRRERKRLGLCLSCGYDLRAGGDRCPECGAATAVP